MAKKTSMVSATLKSVAKATGFSVTTVSRALGGFDDVNDVTKTLIIAEAKRQGYEPNLFARALQKQRIQTIGLVENTGGPRFPDPFFGEFVAGVGMQVAVAGFDLLLSAHPSETDEMDVYRRLVAGRRVDGMVVVRTRYDDARIRYLLDSSTPFVAFGRTYLPPDDTPDMMYIDIDGERGQRELTQHFIDLGHRRIAYIAPPADLMFSHYRVCGYQNALRENGIRYDPDLQIEGDLTEYDGARAAAWLLDLPEPPTAMMTGNDLMAFGVMKALHQRGLHIGQDVAVGGFDDVPLAEHFMGGLTTMHQPIHQIGQQVAQMLLRALNGEMLLQRYMLLKPALVVRMSSEKG